MADYVFPPGATGNISLNAQSTAQNGTPIAVHNSRQFGWVVQGSTGVSAGTVKIEASDDAEFTGTWAEVDSVDLATAAQGGVPLSNALYMGNYPNPFGGFIRGRIATGGVTGGTVTVRIQKLNQ